MVKAKHQKPKPQKQTHVKKKGKQADISEFRAQLDALGLKIVEVPADGNCFFRALADQLEGNVEEHEKYRSMVVQFIKSNREMFEPFIEDEVPFDTYCESMEKDGTWAGNMELQAASLITRTNICIHLHKSPRWYIKNFENRGAQMMHLSYHDGEHYNSVRAKDDTYNGPARPIIIKADADLSEVSKREGSRNTNQAGYIKTVITGSGCENVQQVEQVLQQVNGDVDAAIEYLIAEKASEDYLATEGEKFEKSKVEVKDKIEKTSRNNDEKQNIPRNKACPCGSKKKYKSCCGTAAGKSSGRVAVIDNDKGQKRKKQGKNVNGGPPDVGALCI